MGNSQRPKSSYIMNDILRINNEGAVLSASGRTDLAFARFVKALALLEESSVCQEAHQGWVNCRSRDGLKLEPVLPSEPPALTNTSFAFAHTFAIQYPYAKGDKGTTALCSVAIQYNMATSLQLGKPEHQRDAFALYKNCLKELDPLCGSNADTNNISLTVACLYNMAEISFDATEIDKASIFASLAEQLIVVSSDISQSLVFDEDTLGRFVWADYFAPYSASLTRGAPVA